VLSWAGLAGFTGWPSWRGFSVGVKTRPWIFESPTCSAIGPWTRAKPAMRSLMRPASASTEHRPNLCRRRRMCQLRRRQQDLAPQRGLVILHAILAGREEVSASGRMLRLVVTPLLAALAVGLVFASACAPASSTGPSPSGTGGSRGATTIGSGADRAEPAPGDEAAAAQVELDRAGRRGLHVPQGPGLLTPPPAPVLPPVPVVPPPPVMPPVPAPPAFGKAMVPTTVGLVPWGVHVILLHDVS